MQARQPVRVVGGGLAGLACAVLLHEAGRDVEVLEASDAVGGRVRTDRVDGFLLDRGFQVLSTAYPEVRRLLDLEALRPRAFEPGALVRAGGRFHRIADPWRRPVRALASLFSPLLTLRDAWSVARLRRRLAGVEPERLRQAPETSTLQALRDAGFTGSFIDRFWRPFLGGIFLERELRTSSRMFEFVFAMFARGDQVLPAAGMGAIAEQLAARLPQGAIRSGTPVSACAAHEVRLTSGGRLGAGGVVVATDGPSASRLLDGVPPPADRSVGALWFACASPPLSDGILVLDGDGHGPVNNLCVISAVAPSYAPPGHALVSASVLGWPGKEDSALETAVRRQLGSWFGAQVDGWRLLRVQRIRHAQPETGASLATPPPARLQAGLYVCGDHRDMPSIQGALASGRRAAEAVLAEQGVS